MDFLRTRGWLPPLSQLLLARQRALFLPTYNNLAIYSQPLPLSHFLHIFPRNVCVGPVHPSLHRIAVPVGKKDDAETGVSQGVTR